MQMGKRPFFYVCRAQGCVVGAIRLGLPSIRSFSLQPLSTPYSFPPPASFHSLILSTPCSFHPLLLSNPFSGPTSRFASGAAGERGEDFYSPVCIASKTYRNSVDLSTKTTI